MLFFQILFDQVGDDLCVCLSDELVVRFAQPLFQLQIVFDDAVVNHDHATGTVAVGMRVLFGRSAVSGPAGVANSISAIEGT